MSDAETATARPPGPWSAAGGYREVLAVAVPLVLSTGATTLQHFIDRLFLNWWHSPEALAAAMPAGLLNFTFLSVFLGAATYTGTFVAQYHGAGRPEKVGPAVWQGLWIAVLAGVALLAVRPLAGPMFRLAGHDSVEMVRVLPLEIEYFSVLAFGAFPAILAAALSGFYSGLGRTWPVLWVNLGATAVNVVLDWVLIFGNLGFPEMGMAGAALATVACQVCSCVAYIVLLALPGNERRYRTRSGWRFDGALLRRLLRFGFPSGVHFLLDIAGFSVFILLVGRLGEVPLAATNLAFSVNLVAFMPMIGLGIAVSVLVGQHLGANRPEVAEAATWRGFKLAFGFMAAVAALYVLLPSLFLDPFQPEKNPEAFASTRDLAVVLLRFVAAYCLFDSMNIIFASAVKGAGDTRFVMYMNTALSLVLLVLPTWGSIVLLGRGVRTAWAICTAYIVILGACFLARFLSGKWKSMRVIEEVVPPSRMWVEGHPDEP